MRVRHRKRSLPTNWARRSASLGLLGELDIRVRHTSRLQAKALMFDSNRSLRRFWKEVLGRDELCRTTRGVVTHLHVHVQRFTKHGRGGAEHLEVDPRYFCVIGLIAGHCGMEILCHESVHAACGYWKRIRGRTDLWPGSDGNEEEDIAYPAGRIASALADWCHRRGYFIKRLRRES